MSAPTRTEVARWLAVRWPVLAVLCVAVVVIAPILANPWAISLNDDWTQIFAFQAYLHDCLLDHGEIPARSHMLGSGFPLPAHPEYPILSPLTPVILAFGPILGLKISTAIVFVLGVLGMWLLCRRILDLGRWAAAWAATTFAATGWFAAIVEAGNYPQIYYYWFPLLAWLVLPPRDRTTGALPWARLVAAAAVGTTMLLDGHLNTVVCFLALGLWAVLLGWPGVARVAAFAALTLMMSLYKLVPTVALLRVEDRSIDYLADLEIATANLVPFTSLTCRVDGFALGWVPWLVGVAGLVAWRRAWRPALCLAVAWLLFRGPEAPLDLFRVLHAMPVLRSIDAPSKYFVFFVGFFTLILGAHAVHTIPSRWRRLVAPVLIAACVVPLWWANRPVYASTFTRQDLPTTQRDYVQIDAPYLATEEDWTGPPEHRPDLYVYYRRGFGLVRWEDNFRFPAVAVPKWTVLSDGTVVEQPEYQGEAWMTRGARRATLAGISANSLKIDVSAGPASTLVVNQRYAVGWTCDAGVTSDRAGLLAVAVPAGARTVRCGYRSWPLVYGAVGTILTLAALALAALWRWRRKHPEVLAG